MNGYEIVNVGFSLYNGGWRAEDREDLIREYDLNEDEANEICAFLAEVEAI